METNQLKGITDINNDIIVKLIPKVVETVHKSRRTYGSTLREVLNNMQSLRHEWYKAMEEQVECALDGAVYAGVLNYALPGVYSTTSCTPIDRRVSPRKRQHSSDSSGTSPVDSPHKRAQKRKKRKTGKEQKSQRLPRKSHSATPASKTSQPNKNRPSNPNSSGNAGGIDDPDKKEHDDDDEDLQKPQEDKALPLLNPEYNYSNSRYIQIATVYEHSEKRVRRHDLEKKEHDEDNENLQKPQEDKALPLMNPVYGYNYSRYIKITTVYEHTEKRVHRHGHLMDDDLDKKEDYEDPAKSQEDKALPLLHPEQYYIN